MKKSLPKYQFGNENPCGEGTVWNESLKRCVAAMPQNVKPIDPAFANTMYGTHMQSPNGQWGAWQSGKYQPVSVNPDAASGRVDGRGNSVTFGQHNQTALDQGYNLDSDGQYRKAEIVEDDTVLEYSDGFKGLNALLDTTRFIAGNINDYKTNKRERKKYIDAIQPDAQYNQYPNGINNVPVYFANGGSIYDYMTSKGMDGSYAARKKMFDKMFNGQYEGTAEQNQQALQYLQRSEAVKPTGKVPTKKELADKRNAEMDAALVKRAEFWQDKRGGKKPAAAPAARPNPLQGLYNSSAMAAAADNGVKKRPVVESGLMVDKRNNQAYIVQGGKVQKSFPVLTGMNPDLNQNTYEYDEIKNNRMKGNTPVGGYFMEPSDRDMFGQTGYNLNPISVDGQAAPSALNLAAHYTSNRDRDKLYGMSALDRSVSFGCVNCQKPDLDLIKQNFPQGDTMMVFDPKRGRTLKSMGYAVGGQAGPNAELEQGEVFTAQDGSLNKVPESEPRHEDGGSPQYGVQRVLEDTADKRNNPASKLLKITPDEAEGLVNFRPKSSKSHSKLHEEATAFHAKKLKAFEKKLSANVDYVDNGGGKFAQNALEQNLKLMEKFPTPGDIFDTLYEHQEEVKMKYGIAQGQQMAVGGPGDQLVPWTGDKYQNKANASMYTKDQWLTKLKAKGYVGNGDNISVQKFLYATPAGKRVIDQLHKEKPGTIYGDPAQDRFDGKLGYRWDMALDAEDIMPPPEEIPATPASPVQPSPAAPGQPDKYSFKGGDVENKFSEKLHWSDTMPHVANYLSSLGRTPVDLEQLQYNPLKVHEESALPVIMQNQGDYNAALSSLPNNGVGMANQANLMSNKYAVNQQAIAGVESRNKQKYDQIDAVNAQGQMQIDATNLQLRDQFNNRILQGKEVQRQSKLNAFNDYATMVAQNRKLNREGNLVLQMSPYFDQYGQFNGKKYIHDQNAAEQAAGSGVTVGVETIAGKTYETRTHKDGTVTKKEITKTTPASPVATGRRP